MAVLGGAFGGLNEQPLGWGSPFGSSSPSLASGEQALGNANAIIANGFSLFGGNPATGSGTANPPVASSGIAPASVAPAGASTGKITADVSSGTASTLANYFTRAVIIVLGFIFVAAGLVMFKPNATAILEKVTR